MLLELPHALRAHAQRYGHLVDGVRALVGNVERAIAIGLDVVLPVAAVREVVPALAVGAGPLREPFDAFLYGWIAGEPRDLLRRRVRMRGPSEGFGAGPHDATPSGPSGEVASAIALGLPDQQVLEPVEVARVHGVEAATDC
jgi:hypothetical protein